jgi:glycerol-3-phosphate acyltransferase PlsY
MTFEILWKYGMLAYKTGTLHEDGKFTFPIIIVLACAVLGYLLGSLNFGVIISKIYGRDIREVGSGNAGATNMMRVYGKKASILTFVGDASKSIVAVLLSRFLLLGGLGAYIAGLFVIIGHAWPLYFNFRGGKGVSAIAAFCLVTDPITFVIELAIFVAILFSFKMVSLGSIMIALVYPFILNLRGEAGPNILISFIMAGLVIFLHRKNLVRIFNHTEHKFKLGKKDKKEPVTENGEKEQNEESKE